MKTNSRQILIHFIAAFCMMLAFHIAACFFNIDLYKQINLANTGATQQAAFIDQNLAVAELISFVAKIGYAGTIGLLISLIISLVISLKKNWGWFNSLFVFLLIYVSGWSPLVRKLVPGFLFNGHGLFTRYPATALLSLGSMLLIISLYFFLSARINRFIDKGLPKKT